MRQRTEAQHDKFLDRPFARYGIAVAAVGGSVLLRHALSGMLGEKVLFITFYPAVMLASTLGGFWPGMLATCLTVLVVDYWLLPPAGLFVYSSAADVISLSLFSFMGVFISSVAGLYHRALRRAAEYEKDLAVCESEERYRELVQNANSAIIRWKRDGTITFFNEYAQKFFGYGEEEIIGKNASILVPEIQSTGDDLTGLLKDIVDHPEKYVNNINENVLRDGSRVWMSWTNKPILDENGQVAGILAVGSDITQRKLAEDGLRESEANVRAILNAVQESIWMFGPDGRILGCNTTAAARLDHTPAEIIGLSMDKIISPQLAQSRWERIGAVFSTGRSTEWDDERAGIIFRHTIYPVMDDQGQVSRVVIFSHDITESKLVERRERELEAHRLDFYRRTINAATDGKLLISEPGDIEPVGCGEMGSWDILDLAHLGKMRDEVADLSRKAGMREQRVMSFVGCIVEAGSNAIKHAGGGKARLCSRTDDLIFTISDSGRGIGALALPDVALTEGFSTAGTLGMGYKVMLRFSDQVHLATGPEGTTVAIWMSLHGTEVPPTPAIARLSAWTE